MWRRKALEAFPELRRELNDKHEIGSIYALWSELRPMVRKAHQEGDEDRLTRIYDFALWCYRQKAKDLWNSAGVGFYEHVLDVPGGLLPDVLARLRDDVIADVWGLWEYFEPDIPFGEGVAVSATAHLTINSDGTTAFSGNFHASGGISYDCALVCLIVDDTNRAYAFTEQGHVHGLDEPGSRDYPWNYNPPPNPTIAEHWSDLFPCGGVTAKFEGSVKADTFTLLASIVVPGWQVLNIVTGHEVGETQRY